MRICLTPRLVQKLEPGPGRGREVWFDDHPDAPRGFALRVSASGSRAYYLLARHRVLGQRWIRVGDATQLSLADARRSARARAGDVALDRDPTGDARSARVAERVRKAIEEAAADEWTVEQLVAAYVEVRRQTLSPVTLATYRRLSKRDIGKSELAGRSSRDLTKTDVRDFIARIARTKPAQAWRVLVLLRAAYRWAQDEEVLVPLPDGSREVRARVDRDPTRRVEESLPKVRAAAAAKRERFLADAEITTFWRGCDALPLVQSTFARLVLLLGTRRSETYAARWRDLEFEGAAPTWHIPAEVRKGRAAGAGARRAIDVPLVPLAVELLTALRNAGRPSERVFSGPLHPNRIGGAIQTATGLDDVTLHDLRRTCASGLQRLGAPPHVCSVALGHSREAGSSVTDAHYLHDRREREHRLWLGRWAAHVEHLVGIQRGEKVLPMKRA